MTIKVPLVQSVDGARPSLKFAYMEAFTTTAVQNHLVGYLKDSLGEEINPDWVITIGDRLVTSFTTTVIKGSKYLLSTVVEGSSIYGTIVLEEDIISQPNNTSPLNKSFISFQSNLTPIYSYKAILE